MRYLVSFIVLISVVMWLAFSYSPGSMVSLPTIAFGASTVIAWFPVLVALLLAIVIAIQIWLVYATVHVLRRPEDAGLAATIEQFRLRVGAEALWTALPALMAIGLAVLLFAGSR